MLKYLSLLFVIISTQASAAHWEWAICQGLREDLAERQLRYINLAEKIETQKMRCHRHETSNECTRRYVERLLRAQEGILAASEQYNRTCK